MQSPYWMASSNYGYVQPTWTSATTVWFPGQVPIASSPPPDWEKAKVKAEPDDEFSWLRKRIREIEDLAFV